MVTVSSLEHRPGRLDFDDLQSERSLLAPRRLPAVEVRQRRLRARARPPPARRRPAGDQRPRPPGLLGHQPAEHRPDRADEGRPRGRQPRSSPRTPTRGALPQLYAATAAWGRGRPVLRARRLPARPRRADRGRSRSAAPAIAETGRRLWDVSEELTGVRTYLDLSETGGVLLGARPGRAAGAGRRARAAASWDAIVVGGGHNGLTAAAYLARAGKRVLVCERRERLGGAATLERPFADQRFVVSPCAYLVGLLDDGRDLRARARAPRLRGDPGRPEPLVPVRRRQLLRRRSSTRRGPTDYLRAQGFADADIAGVVGVRRRLRPDPRPAAARPGRRLVARAVAGPRRDRAAAGRRPGADRDRVRGVDRLDARALRRRPAAASTRSRCQGTIGTFAGPARPGHGGDPADAPSGRPARPRLGLGLRRGRARPRVVRDRRRGARGRRHARRRPPRGRDRPGRGGRARVRRADRGAGR